MKKVALISILLFSTPVWADTYLVYNVSPHARVVLSKRSCLVPSLTGNAAALQTDKGKFIQGCWSVDRNNSNHIRIDWNNPAAPGDFSVIEANKFEPASE